MLLICMSHIRFSISRHSCELQTKPWPQGENVTTLTELWRKLRITWSTLLLLIRGYLDAFDFVLRFIWMFSLPPQIAKSKGMLSLPRQRELLFPLLGNLHSTSFSFAAALRRGFVYFALWWSCHRHTIGSHVHPLCIQTIKGELRFGQSATAKARRLLSSHLWQMG